MHGHRFPALLACSLMLGSSILFFAPGPAEAIDVTPPPITVPEVCLPGDESTTCVGGIVLCENGDENEVCGIVIDVDETCPGGVTWTRQGAAVCGTPVGNCEGVDADGYSICGIPVPSCPPAACGLIEQCIAGEGQAGVCGLPAPGDACRVGSVCELIDDCISGGGVRFLSGTTSLCGQDPDPCTFYALCGLECLESVQEALGESNEPGTLNICGYTIDALCAAETAPSDWARCGMPLGACDGILERLCGLPCVEDVLQSSLGWDAPPGQPPSQTDVCGLSTPDQCLVIDALPWPVENLVYSSFGPGTVSNALFLLEGVYDAPHLPVGCAVDCKDNNGSGPVENGDCPCHHQPATPMDWDGDLSLNHYDVDDDCDKLVDDLEVMLQTSTRFDHEVPDDTMDMSPFSDQPVVLSLSVEGLHNVHDLDPGLGSTDPYVSDIHFCHTAPGCPIDKPFQVPELNEADHPDDIGSSHTWDVDAQGWYDDTRVDVPMGSDRYDDVETYGWRTNSGSVTGAPLASVYLKVKDDDGFGRGDDGTVGSETLVEQSMLNLARLAGGSYTAGPEFPMVLSNGDIHVTIALKASRCAVDWAYQIVNGATEVWTAQTVSGATASESAC